MLKNSLARFHKKSKKNRTQRKALERYQNPSE